jgi:hypothetical protein
MECTTLGLTFRGDEKRLLNLFSVIEEDWYRVGGVLFQILRGRESSKIWNASLILRLIDVALVGSKVGWFRLALGD